MSQIQVTNAPFLKTQSLGASKFSQSFSILSFGQFFIKRKPAVLSVAVRMAPLFSGPTIVSISQSPKRSF
jgi:hypothetical protein